MDEYRINFHGALHLESENYLVSCIVINISIECDYTGGVLATRFYVMVD